MENIMATNWAPDSWQGFTAKHLPTYPDAAALDAATTTLETHPPLVFAGEESPGKSPARGSALGAAPASQPRGLLAIFDTPVDCKLQASTAWSAPEEISACYGSSTGHEPSTECKQSLERPADDDFGPIDHPGLRVANVARAGPASIPIRRRRRLRGLRKRCGGLRRSRDPLGSDRAVPVARSPA